MRLALKLATGAGKTTVPKVDANFSKAERADADNQHPRKTADAHHSPIHNFLNNNQSFLVFHRQ
jgi:hypothetical protein